MSIIRWMLSLHIKDMKSSSPSVLPGGCTNKDKISVATSRHTSDTSLAAVSSAAALLVSVAGGSLVDCDESVCPIRPFASSWFSSMFTSILPPDTHTVTLLHCQEI